MTEITTKSTLLECLQIMRGKLKMLSTGDNTLIPKRGRENEYFETRQKCTRIEELIHAYDSEPVRVAIHNWQKMIMKNGGPPKELKI